MDEIIYKLIIDLKKNSSKLGFVSLIIPKKIKLIAVQYNSLKKKKIRNSFLFWQINYTTLKFNPITGL